MSKLSFEDYAQSTPTYARDFGAPNANFPQVGFFSLKNDGEEATVRIMYDSQSDIEVINTHSVPVASAKYPKRVNCPRESHEDVSKCLFCANGASTPLQKKIYVPIIQYTRNADGTVNSEAKIWERPAKYGFELAKVMGDFGPLSDMICKIIRHGVAGSTDTTYQLLPNLPKTVYPDVAFPKKPELFEGFNPIGRMVLNKSLEEAQYYFANGDFPAKQTNAQTPAYPTPAPVAGPAVAPQVPTVTPPPVVPAPFTATQPNTVVPPVAPPTQQFTPPTPTTTSAWGTVAVDPDLPF